MPKVTIEYSANIDADALNLQGMIHDIHTAMGNCDTVAPMQLKILAHPCPYYAVGDMDDNNAVIVITTQLFRERSYEQKTAIGRACTQVVQDYVSKYHSDLNITTMFYITEIERETTFSAEGHTLQQASTSTFSPH